MSSQFDELGLVRQHLDSYNDFVSNGLRQVIEENPRIEPEGQKFYIALNRIEVGEPVIKEADGSETQIFPMEARTRNVTYAAKLELHMTSYLRDPSGIDQKGEDIKVFIGYLPIMLKSKKCPLSNLSRRIPEGLDPIAAIKEDPKDPGGYFIVSGTERVLVTQEDLAPNRILIEKMATSPVTAMAKVFSTIRGFRAPVTLERTKDQTLRVAFPSMPRKVPLVILLRSLGLATDKNIFDAMGSNPALSKSVLVMLESEPDIHTMEDALDYIGKRVAVGQTKEYRIQRAEQVLDRYLLPHIGSTPADRCKKAYYLSQMAQRVLELDTYGPDGQPLRKEDDKDHYANKRFKLAGDLLLILFRVAFLNLTRDIKYQLERISVRGKKPNIRTAVRADVITERLRHALATGNWVGGKAGVSQLLDRTNYMSSLSHLRRVVSPLSRSQPHFEARDLHPTHFGKICPAETPEGPNCGLVKNLALQAYISVGVEEGHIETYLENLGMLKIEEPSSDASTEPVTKRKPEGDEEQPKRILPECRNTIPSAKFEDSARIFLNGRLVGLYPEPDELYDSLLVARRQGRISNEVNFTYYSAIKEFVINCDAGRVRRPLIVCDNNTPRLKTEHIRRIEKGEWKWRDLVTNEILEIVDTEEEEGLLIAMTDEDLEREKEKNKGLQTKCAQLPTFYRGGALEDGDDKPICYTHMEISPSTMLGICASLTPFPEHNRSDRNVYEASMAKQALGVFAINFKYRMDTRAHMLHYPQKPLVKTHGMDQMQFDARPAGQNFVLGLLSWGGYNMEDAIIINKSSIERGLGRSTFFRAYEAEERRYPGGQEDVFEMPDPEVRGYKSPEVYRNLSEDGVVEPETEVNGKTGDVLIGRTSPPRFMEEYSDFDVAQVTRRDTSKGMRHGEFGIADTVLLTETQDGNKLVKVKVRSLRIPEVGDKFASRHGQKGVLGLILPQEDMPVSESGLVPDIIVNPHGIPSRMTVGQMLEILASKSAAAIGKQLYGTAFESVTLGELKDILKTHGMDEYGYEVLYDGRTGEKMESRIFIGIAFYQKLHHLVNDKIHARARGPIQMLTRQPTEGRAREGGLRFGEMERDCLIGHGTAIILKERLLDESDKTIVYFCNACGFLGYHDRNRDKYVCSVCKEENSVGRVTVSYAFKLLLQELMSLGIAPKVALADIA